MQYFAWVKGTRMTWERYERLTTADVDRIKKFWAGCMTKEEVEQFKTDFPDAFNYGPIVVGSTPSEKDLSTPRAKIPATPSLNF